MIDGVVVEKDWTTKAGYRAVALFVGESHRCGYVRVGKDHPLHGVEYGEKSPALKSISEDEAIGKRGVIPLMMAAMDKGSMATPGVLFDVHGSITFSNSDLLDEGDDGWWFGFDCNHLGDKSLIMPEFFEGVHRSLEYVVDECESLARQLTERVLFQEEEQGSQATREQNLEL